MVPGVFRPYTLVDVLGTINDELNSQGQSDTQINGLGTFAETDESTTMADSAATTVQANSTWDSGVWGAFTWS